MIVTIWIMGGVALSVYIHSGYALEQHTEVRKMVALQQRFKRIISEGNRVQGIKKE